MQRVGLTSLLIAVGLVWVLVSGGCKSRVPSSEQLEQEAIDYYVRGQDLALNGDMNAALAELAKAIEVDGSLATAHAAMGDIYRRQKSYDLSAVAYKRACDTNPYNFRNHYNLGVVRQILADASSSLGEFNQQILLAVEAYLKAVTINPDDFDANLNLSVCYYRMDKIEKADEYCNKAIELHPDSADAWAKLGAICERREQLYEAIRAYNRSVELDGRQPGVWISLGDVYVKQGRLKGAVKMYEQAATMDITSPAPLERLGYCHYYLQDYDKAIEYYKAALECDAKFDRACRGLGVAYMTQYVLDKQRTDLRDKALEEWHHSLELNPSQPDLAKLVKKWTPAPTGPEL